MGVKPPPKKGVVTVTYTIFSFDAINHKRDSPGFVYRQNIILYQLLALGGQTTPLISVVGSRDPLFNFAPVVTLDSLKLDIANFMY